MTVTIQYNSQIADSTLSSYTKEWATKNGDFSQAARSEKDYGNFTDDGVASGFSGTKYTVGSSHGGGTGMVVEGDLTYSFMPQHTFYGKMESLELGEGLLPNPDGVGKHLEELQLKLSGLDIIGDYDSSKTKEENHQGDMHKATYGLMCGNADPLLEVLQAKGVDINTPLKDMSIASQLDTTSDVMADAPVVDTVGASDSVEILMAA